MSMHPMSALLRLPKIARCATSRGVHLLCVRHRSTSASAPSGGISSFPIRLQPSGSFPSLSYRLFFERDSVSGPYRISPWHDIPLPSLKSQTRPFEICYYVNEIPKGSRAKMEMATTEQHTPLKQDTKKGELRYFKYGDIPFNYGCLPQTWEDVHEADRDTGCEGDNDPLDVVELSAEPLPTGAVVPVRVLGLLGLIDENQTDWKLLAISLLNPKAQEYDDLAKNGSALIDSVRHWFRYYKTADGKPENKFAFDGAFRDQPYAFGVVQRTHASWHGLVTGQIASNGLNVQRR